MRAVVVFGILAIGCAPPSAMPEDAAVGSIELGTGTSTFVPLIDPAELEVVAGAQGGFHVNLSVRIRELPIEGLRLSYAIARDGVPIVEPTELELNAGRVVRDGREWIRSGDFVVLAIGGPPEVIGARVDVEVTARAASGLIARDRRTVTIVDEE